MADGTGGRALHIVGIGGAIRPGSTTERALRLALGVSERAGASVDIFAGPDLDLPIYAPERPERGPVVRRLVELLRRADGVILASPSYHGGLSGLVKNAIDYTQDLSDDERPYLDGRAIGCVSTGAGWQGIAATLTAIRSVAHALRGWPTPLGAAVNTSEPVFGPDGACLNPVVQTQLELVGRQVLEFATWRATAPR